MPLIAVVGGPAGYPRAPDLPKKLLAILEL